MPRSTRRAGWTAMLLVGAACGDGVGPDGKPGVRVVASPPATDTVESAPPQALVVEVRGADGAPARGVVVRFQAVPLPDSIQRFGAATTLCAPPAPCAAGSSSWPPTLRVDTSDASGRVEAALRFGTVAAPVRIAVAVPELGFEDTVTYTVTPGAATQVVFSVPDTAVVPGARYPVGAAAADRNGNRRVDPITYSTTGTAATVTPAGEVVAGSVGRALVIAHVGTALAGAAAVSVVPAGTIVALKAPFGSAYHVGAAIVTVNLDGAGRREVAGTDGADGALPGWVPGSGEVFFHENFDSPQLRAVDAAGAKRDLLASSAGVVRTSHQGRFSADGRWLFFSGADYRGEVGIWRAGGDGSTAAMVPGLEGASQPAPSPTGELVAYVDAGGLVTVRNMVSGAVVDFAEQGSHPRWSPAGDRVAYLAAGTDAGQAAIVVRAPDGRGRRVVTLPGQHYVGSFDWSPDGQWLIALRSVTEQSQRLELVRVATGDTLPLVHTRDLVHPSWKP